jgi:hypothetical protein
MNEIEQEIEDYTYEISSEYLGYLKQVDRQTGLSGKTYLLFQNASK